MSINVVETSRTVGGYEVASDNQMERIGQRLTSLREAGCKSWRGEPTFGVGVAEVRMDEGGVFALTLEGLDEGVDVEAWMALPRVGGDYGISRIVQGQGADELLGIALASTDIDAEGLAELARIRGILDACVSDIVGPNTLLHL